MRWLRNCLVLAATLALSIPTLAGVDDLENIGADLSRVSSRVIDGVTVNISLASPGSMLASTYSNPTAWVFCGVNGGKNVPLVPGNLSGMRFISSSTCTGVLFPSAQPIVFDLSQAVHGFGLTTIDLMELSNATVSLKAYDQFDQVVDVHTRSGSQGPAGLDLDWYVTSTSKNIVKVKLEGSSTSTGYGLDDLIVQRGSPTIYCTAGTSASGCKAMISATGVASATASAGFVLSAIGVEGSKDGLFFYGTNGGQANSWGNGTSFQCVTPPVSRGGLLIGVGTVGNCDGAFSQDLNARWCATCPKPSHNPGAGASMQAQLWYRDPLNTSNQTTSLSNAIEFGFCP